MLAKLLDAAVRNTLIRPFIRWKCAHVLKTHYFKIELDRLCNSYRCTRRRTVPYCAAFFMARCLVSLLRAPIGVDRRKRASKRVREGPSIDWMLAEFATPPPPF